jgi:SAM-dependent methyltransferase
MECPICTTRLEKLGEFPFADFDGSIFNCSAELFGCFSCDFVRVAFPFSDKELTDYYEKSDSLYTSLSGVGVGGDSKEDLARYAHGLDLLAAIQGVKTVVDVGCSRGGFLKFVRDRTSWTVRGIEIDRHALSCLEQNNIPGTFGSAIQLPLPSGSQEVLTYFHVLEHMNDVETIITEMGRVLVPEGHVLIEVPDAEHYCDARIGDWFWLAMKEHVNHFTENALRTLLGRFGLRVLKTVHSLLPMKNGTFYPSLMAVAQKKGTPVSKTDISACPLQWFKDYYDHETRCFRETGNRLSAFLDGFTDVNCWGIGLEFLNLVAHGAILSDDDRKQRGWRLFDQNDEKRKKTVRGRAISPVNRIGTEGALVISSYLRGDEMAALAAKNGRQESSVFRI